MSIFGPKTCSGIVKTTQIVTSGDAATGIRRERLLATMRTYVDTQSSSRVLKSGDTMTGGLNMGGNSIAGLPTQPLALYRNDEALSASRILYLIRDAFRGLEFALDQKKPVITVWAEENGPLSDGLHEFSFGNGATGSLVGYPMLVPGKIIRMGVVTNPRDKSCAVGLVIDGHEVTSVRLSKSSLQGCAITSLGEGYEVTPGSIITFRTIRADPGIENATVSLLIELDLA